MQLDELGQETQQPFATYLVSKVARKTAANILGTLAAMLTEAKGWKYVCDGMTVESLTLPETPLQPAARFFSGEEAKAIIEAARDPFRTMFAVAAMTGLRAGEILGLMLGRHRLCSQTPARAALGVLRNAANPQNSIQSRTAADTGCAFGNSPTLPPNVATESF